MKRTFANIRPALFALSIALGCGGFSGSLDLENAPSLGPEGAPTEIVVFSDFQCTFCKRAARELARIHRSQPNRVKIYFKHFPLPRHPQAEKAALAAEAARLQGKFWEMHDLIFMHSSELTDGIYEKLARELDLDVARFLVDMASPPISARVEADRAQGKALRVSSTPYFLINRRPFRGSYADLAEQLDGMDRTR